MSITVASAILRGTWLIDPATARTQLPILENIINGKAKFEPLSAEEKEALQPKTYGVKIVGAGHVGKIVAAAMVANSSTQKDESIKLIQVINVTGVMLKYSEECGPIGMVDIAQRIKNANNNEKIDAIVINIDSPGGMVDGTQTLSDAIKASRKPVIGFVDDGMACSAAYWIGSSCNEFYASHKTDVIGSIGVYTTLADFKSKYEKDGLPIIEVYADQSSEKNRDVREALKGDTSFLKNNRLNPLAENFIAAVKQNRDGKLNLSIADPMKGDTYMATRATEIGLIDGVKTFDEVLTRAAELSVKNADMNNNSQANSSANSDNMKIKILSTQTLLASVLGLSFAQGETEKEHDLTDENIAAISNKLTQLSSDLSTANADKANLQNEKTQLSTELESSKAEVTRLGKQAGTLGADARSDKSEGAASGEQATELKSDADDQLAKLKAEMGIKA